VDNIRGKDGKIKYRQNNVPVEFRAESFDVEEIADEGWDSVCGEDFDRPWIVINGCTLTIRSYVHNVSALEAWIADVQNQQARVAELKKVIGLSYQLRDGTTKAYLIGGNSARSPYVLNVSGRKAAIMQTIKIRFGAALKAAPSAA
jgi:hypothetical protein